MKRRHALGAGLSAAAGFAGLSLAPRGATAQANDFPNRPITFIVPSPAGGLADQLYRAMSVPIRNILGQPLVIVNRPGASTTLGPSQMAATAKPDGYTICQFTVTTLRLPQMQQMTYDPIADFTHIARMVGVVWGITTSAESGFKTFGEVLAYAKANPGRVTYATPGIGSPLHLTMEQIGTLAGVQFNHIPMKGAGETLPAVLGGHVTLMADAALIGLPMVKAGKLRLLNTWTDARLPNLPDVPTLREAGLNFAESSPTGIAGPKGMEPAVVAKLAQAFEAAARDKDILQLMTTLGQIPMYLGPDEYTAYLRKTYAEDRDLLGRLGLLKKA